MRDDNLLNISSIETYFNEILDGDLSENVYPSTLPSTIPDSWKDMVVISCDTSLTDYNAYASGGVNIYLYAKPLSNGKKNVAVMSKMEKRLNEIIKEQVSSNSRYRIHRSENREDYDAVRNLHVNIVRIWVLII